MSRNFSLTGGQVIPTGLVLVLSATVCWVSFTAEPADAFLFPRLISSVMLVLALSTFVRAVMGRSLAGGGIGVQTARNLAPGLIVLIVMIFWAAKTFGFYTTTLAGIFLLITLYDPSPNDQPRTWIMRAVISIGFVAVLYGLFTMLLKVQTPRGLFM